MRNSVYTFILFTLIDGHCLQSLHCGLESAQLVGRFTLHRSTPERDCDLCAPEIINSDQGCQFTCKAWLDACAQHPQMRVSMDDRGRAKDNIWIERFWKTKKYEYIYILPEDFIPPPGF